MHYKKNVSFIRLFFHHGNTSVQKLRQIYTLHNLVVKRGGGVGVYNIFLYFSIKSYVAGFYKNCLRDSNRNQHHIILWRIDGN